MTRFNGCWPDGALKMPSDRPKKKPHPWYVPGVGFTYLSDLALLQKRADTTARFTAAAAAALAQHDATKRPTRWPAKHMPLLVELRARARKGWRWNWNGSKDNVAGMKAGALLLIGPDTVEREYASLDIAAEVLCGSVTAKRTGKADLVSFLRAVEEHLPVEHRAEATRLLEAA